MPRYKANPEEIPELPEENSRPEVSEPVSKKKYRVVLVAPSYIIIDKGGHNEFLKGSFNVKPNEMILL